MIEEPVEDGRGLENRIREVFGIAPSHDLIHVSSDARFEFVVKGREFLPKIPVLSDPRDLPEVFHFFDFGIQRGGPISRMVLLNEPHEVGRVIDVFLASHRTRILFPFLEESHIFKYLA